MMLMMYENTSPSSVVDVVHTCLHQCRLQQVPASLALRPGPAVERLLHKVGVDGHGRLVWLQPL